MLPVHSDSEDGFHHLDALVFGDHLLRKVQNLLPIPATVGFWLHGVFLFDHVFTPEQQQLLTAERQSSVPFVKEGLLIIPLRSKTQVEVDIVVHDVDPTLLKKMAVDWLLGLQENIQACFLQTRQIYTDPGTGLYNQRALNLLLSAKAKRQSLFLIATVSRSRSIAGGFQKIEQLSSLLEVVIHDPVFYFGQGVFGCVNQLGDRKAALDFSHRLITRLKREGLHRVHVGFSCLTGDSPADKIFRDSWLALLEAERRGPYSLCEASVLHSRDQHPFALPPGPVLQKLQRKWRGLERFGLLLISFAGTNEEKLPELAPLMPADSCLVELSAEQQFVLFPAFTAASTAKQVKALAKKIKTRTGLRPGMGFCHWPSAAASKVDCIRNCRKAILHGTFYGTGAVVGFDFLSLNVSGDLYFDEGDYKRAIREYRSGLQMQPGDINLLNSLGVALAEVNRHRDAIACFSRVLDSDGTNHMALVNKGMSCRLMGWNEQAVQCFEKAIDCSDHVQQASLELYLQLGRLYCMAEQYESAVALFLSWQELRGQPEEFMFFQLMGEACMGSSRNHAAIESLQRSLQLHPRNADSLSMLGLLYVLEGEGADVGLSLCEKAISMDEADPDHFFRKASALFHLGELEKALSSVRSALKIKRNLGRAVLLRGRIYEGLGAIRLAGQSYRRILGMKGVGGSWKKQAQDRLNDMERK